MLSVDSYIEKIHNSRDIMFRKRLLRYRPDFDTYKEIKSNSESLIVNMCKLVFVLSKVQMNGMSDNEIVQYVEMNYDFGSYIRNYLDSYNYWLMFTARRDEPNKERYLKAMIGYSEIIENVIRNNFGLPLYTNIRTSLGASCL